MTIPPEIQVVIAQVRRQYPQLAHASDEQIAQLIMAAMQQQATSPADEQDLEKMSAKELDDYGEVLLNQGRWQEAEKYFLLAVEKAEQTKDYVQQTWATVHLASLCRRRGDLPQALTLYQQALTLAGRLGDRRLQGVIYDQIGTTYRRQGRYPQAIEYYKQSLSIFEERHEDDALAANYGNLGNVYQQQGDYDRAIESYQKGLELNIKLGDDQGTAKKYGNLGIVYKKFNYASVISKAQPVYTATWAMSIRNWATTRRPLPCTKKRWRLWNGLVMNLV